MACNQLCVNVDCGISSRNIVINYIFLCALHANTHIRYIGTVEWRWYMLFPLYFVIYNDDGGGGDNVIVVIVVFDRSMEYSHSSYIEYRNCC